MKIPKLSLIIAMYNIADYIGDCLRSCINQDQVNAGDYEILIVDDGSTDNSLEIASAVIKDFPFAKILSKENGGVSDARNYGLKHAKGEYVWFIDGDDLLAENAIKTIIDSMKIDAQVFIISYYDRINDTKMLPICFSKDRLPCGIFNAYELISEGAIGLPPLLTWLQIQKREFILANNLEFLKGVRNEDLEYTAKLFSVATKVYYINEFLYLYRVYREDGFMSTYKNNSKRIDDLLKIYKSVELYLSLKGISHQYKRIVLSVITKNMIYCLYSQDKDEYKKSKKFIKRSELSPYRILKQNGTAKELVLYFIVKFIPYNISRFLLAPKLDKRI